MLRLCLLVLATVPAWGATTFTDNTFNLADYAQTTFNDHPSDVTIIVSQTASGNPGTALDITETWSTPFVTFNTAVALVNTTFVYDPSTQGAIQGLDFSVDRYVTLVGGTLGANNNAAALILQNGKFYFDSITGPALQQGQYQTVAATGLVASDFQLVDLTTGALDNTQHPDFSASGSAMDFGVIARFGHINASADGGTLNVREDNLSYSITTIPEPTAIFLTLLGLTPFVALRRRR